MTQKKATNLLRDFCLENPAGIHIPFIFSQESKKRLPARIIYSYLHNCRQYPVVPFNKPIRLVHVL